MKANELRINNLLQDSSTGSLLIVSALSNNTIISSVLDRDKYPLPNGWKAKPILLTEEWLKRFGFKSIGDTIRKDVSFFLEVCYMKFDKTIRIQTKGNGFTEVLNIKHVHQLQNLYFALTGQELSVT